MKTFWIIFFLFCAGVFFFFVVPQTTASQEICVTVPPLKYFMDKIVQGKWQVKALVQPGQDHETYEITPKQMVLLMGMKLYFTCDFPFERNWMGKIREMNPKVQIVDLPQEMLHSDNVDLHLWTSPKLAQKIAQIFYEKISAIDPGNEALYRKGLEHLQAELTSLDQEIREMLAPFRGRKFYTFHPAWNYFAKDYGLEEISIEKEGKEPSVQDLLAIIDAAKREGIKVIFVQKGMSQKSSEVIAQAIGGKVEEIDPIEEDYIANMKKVSLHIQKAFEDARTAD